MILPKKEIKKEQNKIEISIMVICDECHDKFTCSDSVSLSEAQSENHKSDIVGKKMNDVYRQAIQMMIDLEWKTKIISGKAKTFCSRCNKNER